MATKITKSLDEHNYKHKKEMYSIEKGETKKPLLHNGETALDLLEVK